MKRNLIIVFLIIGISQIYTQVQFGEAQILSSSFNPRASECLDAADMDNDGDIDLIAASYNGEIFLYENINGNGDFTEQVIAAYDQTLGSPISVCAVDLNNDGYHDIFYSGFAVNAVGWFENLQANNSFGNINVITQSRINGESVAHHSNCCYSADLDGDGDNDIMYGALERICWHENTDGVGTFSTQKIISTSMQYPNYIYSFDIDSDGDADVCCAGDDKIVWYENTDGAGNFSDEKIISNSTIIAWSLFVADINSDQHLDILSASYQDNKFAWYENINGTGAFSNQKIISRSSNGLYSISAADLDNDGDMDVLSASHWDNKIVWYENLNGEGAFGSERLISNSVSGAMLVYTVDVDADNDDDVIAVSYDNQEILLFKNQVITSVEWNGNSMPSRHILLQNYPNPFNPSTTVKYTLYKSGNVTLKIYNLSGEEVETLVSEYKVAGEHEVKWQPEGLPSGIYLARLKAGAIIKTIKLVLLK
ncbi:MAG: T9SS type A sorting domain-containing protein [Ignavibacteria bacterium]|jgi:hypothetical protein